MPNSATSILILLKRLPDASKLDTIEATISAVIYLGIEVSKSFQLCEMKVNCEVYVIQYKYKMVMYFNTLI